MVLSVLRLVIGGIAAIFELVLHVFWKKIFLKNVYSPDDQYKKYTFRVGITGIISFIIFACGLILYIIVSTESRLFTFYDRCVFFPFSIMDAVSLLRVSIVFPDIRRRMNYKDSELYFTGASPKIRNTDFQASFTLILLNSFSLCLFSDAVYRFLLLLGVFGK